MVSGKDVHEIKGVQKKLELEKAALAFDFRGDLLKKSGKDEPLGTQFMTLMAN